MRLTKITRKKTRQLPRRVLSFTLSATLAINSLLAGLPVLNPQVAEAASTVTAMPSDGWTTSAQDGGQVRIITSSDAISGSSSLQLSTKNTNPSKATLVLPVGSIPLSSMPAMSYDTKIISTPNTTSNISYQLGMDVDNNGTLDGRFVFESYYNGSNTIGLSQSWNVATGKFWPSNANVNNSGALGSTGGGAYATNFTLAEALAAYPNARILTVEMNLGSYNPNTKALLDNLNFNNTIYDFEAGSVCTYDFTAQKMWEVTWGYGFNDRNGGAPLFTPSSNGGLITINGAPTTWNDFHLYITDNGNYNPRHIEYGFADGTVRAVDYSWTEVSGCNIPTNITWSIVPTLSFVANYIDHADYDGISLEIQTPNLTDGTDIEITVNRTNGTPDVWTNTSSGSVMDALNGASHTVTAPIVIVEGSRTRTSSGSWQTSGEPWNNTQEPTSITVRVNRAGGAPTLEMTLSPIGTVWGTDWSNIQPLLGPAPDFTNPSTPEITTPTARQWFKSTPIVNAWTASTDDVGVDHYQVAYRYDDGHTFGGSTCAAGEVVEGLVVSGCRDVDGTTRNHNPGSGEEGGVTIWVRAFDAAGNASDWSDSVHYYYDHTAPTTDIVAPTGTVGNSFTVSGDAHDNLSLNRVYVQLVNRENNLRYGGTTINLIPNGINPAGVNAHWSKTYDATALGLPNGTYAAHVAVVDMAGNTSSAGWTANFTVDSTAPAISGIVLNGQSVADADVRSANCTIPSNYYLVNGTIDLDATITDTLSNVSSAKYKIRKVSTGGCTQTAIYQSNTANMTNTGGNDWETVAISMIDTNADVDLVDGNYTIQLTLTDSVGNQATKYVDITVDNTAPAQPQVLGFYKNFNTSNPIIPCGGYTNDTKVQIDWADNTDGDIAGYWFGTKNNAKHKWVGAGSFYNGNMTPGNNPYFYTVIAVDHVGNESQISANCAITLDQDAPFVAITSPANGDVLNGPVQVKGTITDANPHHYWLHITKDGSTILSQTVNASSDIVNQTLRTLSDNGAYKVTLAARDSADNRSGDVVVEFIIDNLSPVIAIDNVTVSLDKKLSFDISVVEQGLAGLQIVAANIYDAANTTKVLSLGSGNPTRLNTPHGGLALGTLNFADTLSGIDVSGLATGTYTIRSFARDHANNSVYFTFQFDVDNTAPEAPTNLGWTTVLGNVITNGGATNEENGTASWDASTSSDVNHYVYKYWNDISTSPYSDDATAWTASNAGLARNGAFNQGEGTHYFCVVAVDFAGNESVCSDVFVVTYDITEPGITLASVEDGTSTSRTITGTGEPGAEIEVTVHSTPQTKNTVVDGSGNWSLDFTALEIGNHTVNAKSTDAAGNTSTATTTFAVTATNTNQGGQVQGIQDNRSLTATPTPTPKQGNVLAAITELPGTGASTAAFAIAGGLTTLVGAILTIRQRKTS